MPWRRSPPRRSAPPGFYCAPEIHALEQAAIFARDWVCPGMAALLPMVEAHDMAGYVPVVRQDHLWDTNWKLLAENFMESYHLPVAHRATVGA